MKKKQPLKISSLSVTSTLIIFKDYFNLMLLLQNACIGGFGKTVRANKYGTSIKLSRDMLFTILDSF